MDTIMEETVTGSPLRGYQRPAVEQQVCGTTAQLDTVVQYSILFTYIQCLLKVFVLYIYTKFTTICTDLFHLSFHHCQTFYTLHIPRR